MAQPNFQIVLHHLSDRKKQGTVTAREVARLAGCTSALVLRLAAAGAVDCSILPNGECLIPESAVPRLQRGLRIRRDLRVTTNSLGLVLDLLERIDDLESELEKLRRG